MWYVSLVTNESGIVDLKLKSRTIKLTKQIKLRYSVARIRFPN